MSSQVRRTPMPMRAPAPTSPLPWILVAVLIFGAGVLGSAALAGSFTLLVVGAVLVLAALAGTAALRRPRSPRR